MGKSPETTTQNTFPPWLMSALKPLISNSAKNMGTFANQGFEVLQGGDYRNAAPGGTQTLNVQGPKFPPWLEERINSGGGGPS
jgi:hypothetical protein